MTAQSLGTGPPARLCCCLCCWLSCKGRAEMQRGLARQREDIKMWAVGLSTASDRKVEFMNSPNRVSRRWCVVEEEEVELVAMVCRGGGGHGQRPADLA